MANKGVEHLGVKRVLNPYFQSTVDTIDAHFLLGRLISRNLIDEACKEEITAKYNAKGPLAANKILVNFLWDNGTEQSIQSFAELLIECSEYGRPKYSKLAKVLLDALKSSPSIAQNQVSSQQDCNSTSDTEAQSQPNLARIDTVSNIVHKSTKLQNSKKALAKCVVFDLRKGQQNKESKWPLCYPKINHDTDEIEPFKCWSIPFCDPSVEHGCFYIHPKAHDSRLNCFLLTDPSCTYIILTDESSDKRDVCEILQHIREQSKELEKQPEYPISVRSTPPSLPSANPTLASSTFPGSSPASPTPHSPSSPTSPTPHSPSSPASPTPHSPSSPASPTPNSPTFATPSPTTFTPVSPTSGERVLQPRVIFNEEHWLDNEAEDLNCSRYMTLEYKDLADDQILSSFYKDRHSPHSKKQECLTLETSLVQLIKEAKDVAVSYDTLQERCVNISDCHIDMSKMLDVLHRFSVIFYWDFPGEYPNGVGKKDTAIFIQPKVLYDTLIDISKEKRKMDPCGFLNRKLCSTAEVNKKWFELFLSELGLAFSIDGEKFVIPLTLPDDCNPQSIDTVEPLFISKDSSDFVSNKSFWKLVGKMKMPNKEYNVSGNNKLMPLSSKCVKYRFSVGTHIYLQLVDGKIQITLERLDVQNKFGRNGLDFELKKLHADCKAILQIAKEAGFRQENFLCKTHSRFASFSECNDQYTLECDDISHHASLRQSLWYHIPEIEDVQISYHSRGDGSCDVIRIDEKQNSKEGTSV